MNQSKTNRWEVCGRFPEMLAGSRLQLLPRYPSDHRYLRPPTKCPRILYSKAVTELALSYTSEKKNSWLVMIRCSVIISKQKWTNFLICSIAWLRISWTINSAVPYILAYKSNEKKMTEKCSKFCEYLWIYERKLWMKQHSNFLHTNV